jgi:hypothetical protein
LNWIRHIFEPDLAWMAKYRPLAKQMLLQSLADAMKIRQMSCCLSTVILTAISTPCDSPMTMSRVMLPRLQPSRAPEAATPTLSKVSVLAATPKPQAVRTTAAPSGLPKADITPLRSVTPTEPPRRWVLSAATWQSINDSPLQIDVDLDQGQEYFGVRIAIPFGS